MSTDIKSLWGIPIVITDALPEGEIILGRFPSAEELFESGLSFEQWLATHAKEFCRVTGLIESE